MNGQMPPKDDGPRINEAITNPKVLVIDADGEKRGVMSIEDALDIAEDAGMDLVEVSPNADTPVCKVLDYGKFKYQAQKKANEAKKKQKVIEVKEIKLRPGIDTHDHDVTMRPMKRFFADGAKVKVSMAFRGREIAHTELGFDLLQKVKSDTDEFAKVEYEPKMEGRQMIMILSPR